MERVTARSGELEWDYILRTPRTSFDMTARVSGVEQVQRRDRDRLIQWMLSDGLSVSMGEMVVKDALGRELYRALPQATRSTVRLQVPPSVLANARYPVVVDPVISPPMRASDPAYGPSRAVEDDADVAWGAGTYLVVWEDGRSAGGDIYGTRVSPEGRILDPDGIPIGVSPTRNDDDPVVAWNGSNFLVVWRSGYVFGARVSPSGDVLDNNRIQISPRFATSPPGVASDGDSWFVVWADDRNEPNASPSGDIFGSKVDASGTVVNRSGVAIAVAPGSQQNPTVAWGGTQYLVGWTDSGETSCCDVVGRIARVSRTAEVIDTRGIPVSDAALSSIAWDGTRFLVVWQGVANGAAGVVGARVTPEGTVLDPDGVVIAEASAERPDVAWNGSTYLVVWSDDRLLGPDRAAPHVFGARLTPQGIAPDSEGGFLIGASPDWQGRGLSPAVASDGTNFLVTWENDRDQPSSFDIQGARVTSSSAVLDPEGFVISHSANDQTWPAIAWDGSNYLVVWEDYRSGRDPDIYGARVSHEGDVLDGSGFVISQHATREADVAVQAGGGTFLVVWNRQRPESPYEYDLYGARISAAGAVLDQGGIPISTAELDQVSPDVAWNGTYFLVAWMDQRNRNGHDIYGSRISPLSGVLDPAGLPLATGSEMQELPAVASDGQDFLLVYNELVPPNTSGTTVRGVKVTSAGLTGPETVIGDGYSSWGQHDSDPTGPALSWNGTHYLVVWSEITPETSLDVHGAFVDRDGVASGPRPIRISAAWSGQARPTVAWSGVNHVVVWEDGRFRDQNAGCPLCAQGDRDLYGARVTADGDVLDAAGFQIAITTTDEVHASLVRGGGSRVGLAYQRLALERPWAGAQRVFLRFIDEGRPSTASPTPTPTPTASPTPTPTPTASSTPPPPPPPECNDGRDNDGDGRTDHPNDPGCDSTDDNDETDPNTPQQVYGGSRGEQVTSGPCQGFTTGSAQQNPEGSGMVIVGTGGDDLLQGGQEGDLICGLGGADTVNSAGGGDTIYGNGGKDALNGDAGNDAIYGNAGKDVVIAGDDRDVVRGGKHHDNLSGGPGKDRLLGQAGWDTLKGNADDDFFNGGGGNDIMEGGGGDDTARGEGGDDVLKGFNGNDNLVGGMGSDILRGSGGSDVLNGGPGDDALNGGAGRDTCRPGGGSNVVRRC